MRICAAAKQCRHLVVIASLAVLLGAVGCQSLPKGVTLEDVPALAFESGMVDPGQAIELVTPPDPLYLTDEMKAFVDQYVLATADSKRAQLRALNASIHGGALLGVSYDAEYTGTAEDVFRSGSANCLGYSHLFVALARYAGIDAHFQQVIVKPNWNRRGDVLTVNQHVNVTGRVGKRTVYNVDIDDANFRRASRMHRISDDDALLQYYNNLAMEAMSQEDILTAYAYLVLALRLDGGRDYLWTNLGYIFRKNGQYDQAASSYDRALALAPHSTTALQNYQVLYHHLGDEEAVQKLDRQLASYRRSNPYYHAQLSQLSAAEDKWDEALQHIAVAIDLKPDEFEFQLARLGYLAVSDREQQAAKLYDEALALAEKPHQKALLHDYLERWNIPVADAQSGANQ